MNIKNTSFGNKYKFDKNTVTQILKRQKKCINARVK